MRTRKIFSATLALAILGAAVAQAQELLPAPLTLQAPVQLSTPVSETAPTSSQTTPGMLSSWIAYTRPDCCGPVGGNGPIDYELFLRSGFSIPVGGAVFGRTLETGWEIEGGARSLFFNPAMDRDWSIDLSIRNIIDRGEHPGIRVPYELLVPSGTNPITGQPSGFTRQPILVSIRELNRTDVSVGVGRDWYLWGAANACGEKRWRAGLDAGGRLGTAKAEFNEISHHTDTTGGVYIGLHTELEIPYGCCSFLVGFRAEWDYTWMDILQIQNNSDLQDVNLLFTFGVRY